MQELFLELVRLSMVGSLFAMAVMLLRLVFRKAPKWIFVLLWGVVALRLVLPVSVESSLSVVPDKLASGQLISNVGDGYIGDVTVIYKGAAGYDEALKAGRKPVYTDSGSYVVTRGDTFAVPKTVENTVFPLLSRIWLAGTAVMLCYMAVSYLLLKRKMEEATLLWENIWQSEQTASPFVLGLLRPRIYLPYTVAGVDMENVIAHERAHICRKDHWWKPIGFVLLSVYWFNPVLWLAYILLCRDIEAACDERVIRTMDKTQLRGYSAALLHCSVHRRSISACPLAFGETGVKERIKRVMHYKKPAFWLIALAVTAAVIAGIFLLTDPIPQRSPGNVKTGNYYIRETDTTYRYELKLTGRLPNAATETTFYVYTDDPTLTFRKLSSILTSAAYSTVDFYISDSSITADTLLELVDGIAKNDDPAVAASSNPYDHIAARQSQYNKILAYGGEAVDCFVEQLRTGENGLRGYIMAAACADITGIGVKTGEYDPSWWATAQEWLALYDESEKPDIVPPLIATDYTSGKQARFLSFSYSRETPDQSIIVCGIAPWQGSYGDANTLILDGKYGQNQILLTPAGATYIGYTVYLPDGTVYDDGTRTMYDSLSMRVSHSDRGLSMTAPFTSGEYIYAVELLWEQENIRVTYGLKLVMTGQESDYDRAVRSVFDAYREGSPLIAVTLVDKYTLANAAYSSDRYLFRVENVPNAPIWVEVYQHTGEIVCEVEDPETRQIYPPYAQIPIQLPAGSLQMSIEDVLALSKLGMELTWEDLRPYQGTDVGSGLYIMQYDIDPELSLLVGDGKTTGTPMYARLIRNSSKAYCDIRTEDVAGFLMDHS